MEGVLSWKEYPGKKRVNRRKSRLEYRKGKLTDQEIQTAIQMKGSSLVM